MVEPIKPGMDRALLHDAWAEAERLARDTRAVGPGGQTTSSAIRTIALEMEALGDLRDALQGPLGKAVEQAVKLIQTARGRLVVSGMGKSGLVGRKIAATFASTGTPAFFLHPADASHGDLGMISADDVVLILSWSGETSELSDLVAYCRRFGVPIVAMTSRPASSLAKVAATALIAPEVHEACPHGLAPTSSTTLQIVLGDALAIALVEQRGFSSRDFHHLHPKGMLGARLLTIGAIMSIGDAIPRVGQHSTLLEAVLEITNKRFGVTAVVDDENRLIGSFTDGDLRRSLSTTDLSAQVAAHMSRSPLGVTRDLLASEAIAIMNKRPISQLFVIEDRKLIGIVHLHDILKVGVA